MVLLVEMEREQMTEERDYAPLGDAMEFLARRRRVRKGPYGVRSYMARRFEELGRDSDKEVPSGPVVSKHYYGDVERIDTRLIPAFTTAFDLSDAERLYLSWAANYPNDPRSIEWFEDYLGN